MFADSRGIARSSLSDQLWCCLMFSRYPAPQVLVPSLQGLLSKDRPDDLRVLAAAALAKAGNRDSKTLRVLKQGIHSEIVKVRTFASVALLQASRFSADAMHDVGDAFKQTGETLVICPTHAESDRTAREIRQRLKDEGLLAKEERELATLRQINLTEAQRRDFVNYLPGDVIIYHQHARGHKKGSRLTVGKDAIALDQANRFTVYRPSVIRLAAGDRIRITKNSTSSDRHRRLNNGDLASVKRINRDGTLVLGSGVTIAPDFVEQGYVVTSHASQGRSIDRVILAQSSESFGASNLQQAYVSLSRAKKQTLVFTDDRRALLEAIGRSDERMTATDLLKTRAKARRRVVLHHYRLEADRSSESHRRPPLRADLEMVHER